MPRPYASSSGFSSAISRWAARASSAPRSSLSIGGLYKSYAYAYHLRMPTIRSVTRSISIQAPPTAVLDVVGDARALPRWAPGFARAVRADGSRWIVDTGAGEARIDVSVSRERGSVDIVSADDPRRGVFTRVLANGDGSEYLFTQFFPDSATDADVQRQVAVVEGELETVRRLSEV